ncbi:MAG: fibronectin type III domain-containing protein [Paludibacter sp.]
MKKLLFILTLCLVTVMTKAAMPYDYSTFFASSATGSGVLEKTGYSVLTWGIAATNNGGTNPTIASSTMNYTDANSTSYIDNNAGSAITLASIAPAATLRSSIFYLTSSGLAAATTYYVSALINITAATASSSTFINLNNSSTGNSSYGKVIVKTSGSGYTLTVAPGASGTNSAPSSTIYTFGSTHLIVLKFVYTNVTNSTDAYLYIDPNFGAEGSPTLSGLNNTTPISAIKGLVITQNIGVTGTVAGLRFGTSWADVVKGKLATPSVATGATPITSGGFTANWASVTNASNYTLTVYNSNGSTNQSISGISGSATSYDVTGLSPSTSYSYKVTAIGNGTTFSNSDQSVAASFSTIASAVPVLSVDAISGVFGSQAINSTTGPNSFTISGTLLTTENVTVGALTGYSYSTTAGGTYTSSLSLSQSGGTFSQQIFVKFTPTTYTSYNGNIVVGGGGVGVSTVNCAVTGSGIYAEPTTQASAVTFSSFTGTSFTVNWTAGNGSNSIVLIKSASAVNSNPLDATSYTANTAIGSGSQIGTGNYVVYNSTGNSVAVTGLTKGTKYYVSVYTFSGSGGTENYLTSSSASGSQMAVSTITSSGSGTWASLGAGQYDDVVILNGHTIDVAVSGAKCNNLTINTGGKVWANTAAQTLSVYGTSLVCDGTFGDSNNALTSGSQLVLAYGNIIDITGNGGIYPYKIQPVTGMTPIGVTFDANVTATYGTAGVQSDNTGNTNVTLTVSAGKTLTVPGNMTPGGSSTALCSGNVIIDVYGTINITGTLNTTAAVGKTSTLTVYDKGLITAGKFNLSPAHQVQAATYTVNSGGEIRVTGTSTSAVDCSHPTITSYVTGGGTFSTTSAGSTVALGNSSGLNSSTGPIRTTTCSFDAATNFSFVGTAAQVPGNYFPSNINGLTVNNTAGVTLGGSTTVNGNLGLTLGTLTVGANTLTLSGTKSGSGTIDCISSTIVYNGSIAQTTSTLANLNNLTINNAAGVTLGASTTLNGTLTLTSGLLNTVANTLTIGSAGSISGASSSNYINGNLALIYGSTGSKTFPIGAGVIYRPVTINATALDVTPSTFTVSQTESAWSGTLPANTTSTLARNWTIAQTGSTAYAYNLTLDGTGFTPVSTAKILENNAGTVTSYSTTGTYSTTGLTSVGSFGLGDYTAPTISGIPTIGTATAGNAQASVAFTAPTSDGGSSIIDYTVTSSPGNHTATGASSPIVVTGLTNGTGYTFTVTARNSVGSSSASDASNSVTPVSPSVTVSSDANLSTYSPTSGTDVTVSAGTLTIDADATVKTMTVAPGAKLTLASGKTLSVVGALTLQSDATNGTGTFVDNGGTLTAGTTNVQQYLTSGRNWYISSPVSGATSNVFNAASNVLYSYDETNAAWPQISDNGTGLGVMTGYVANMATNGAVTFTGTLNTGAQQIGLTRHAGVAKEGFNLVGNPYPSYLNFESAMASTSTANVSSTMWFRTKNAATWVFDTYNAIGHIGTSNYNNFLVGVTANIPPMQAFWVRVNSGQTTGTLAVDNTMRSHIDQTEFTRFKAPATTVPVLHLQVTNGTNSDEAIVLFNSNASNGYDAYDSEKMTNDNAAIPEIYTLAGTEQLVINGLNSIQYDTEIPLGFTTGQSNTFTIKASQFSNFVSGTQIVLRDKVLNVEQDLTVANYSFTSDVTKNNTSRFAVLFKAPSVATGINSANNANVWISTNANNQLMINGAGSVAVYNAIGQRIAAKNMSSTKTVFETPLQSGVYFVTVSNAGKSVTQKVIIK